MASPRDLLTEGTPKAGPPPMTPSTPQKPVFKIVILEQDIEKLKAAEKRDRHSGTKICCYACCIFIPIALLIILAIVIAFIINFRPGEGEVPRCRNATGGPGGTDTLLICKEVWERMCWGNRTALSEGTVRLCASGGCFPNRTYSHDWKVNVTSVGTYVPY